MKTIKKNKQVKRVSDKQAQEMVKEGWKYCSKSEWKKKVRDKLPPVITLKKKKK
tara:strand:+ start:1908 stop:2069 length:162 start_codon:yes stop_codon:yes gene_type:complete